MLYAICNIILRDANLLQGILGRKKNMCTNTHAHIYDSSSIMRLSLWISC